ncbi:MAG: sigma-70 family RNA polymerase sigma factor [Acidobacteria bacterium]|nr:sigma-70 family RNA polymerase sigma factor [Acidobacteriota bacterium]
MERTARGETRAFATIVDDHKDSLVNYLCHVTGNREEAEEFAQEAFLRLYRAAPRYREQGRLAPYLFRIATNLVRSHRRRQRRWSLLRPFLEPPSPRAPEETAAAALFEEELCTKVREAIAELPLKFRACLVLHEIEGWPYQRIAQAEGCREGTVKSRIHRARQMLKSKLAPYWSGGSP